MDGVASLKRSREDSDEPELLPDSPAAKRIRDDLLLDIYDDDDDDDDGADGGQADDLATVIRSFEEEISLPPPPPLPAAEHMSADLEDTYQPQPQPQPQPELGYLLEASDDELGLPPTSGTTSLEVAAAGAAEADDVGFGQIWGLEDDVGYGFVSEFGIPLDTVGPEEGVVIDVGLFDYTDVFCGPSDLSDLSCRSETLPAV